MAWTPTGGGQLRSSVRFEREVTRGAAVAGNVLTTWTPVATVRGRLEPLKGDEAVIAARIAGTALYYLHVRSSEAVRSVTTACRVVNDRTGEVLNIRWIANPDERERWRVMMVEVGVPT